jgi:inosine-uridine nucleoside N-ribohydrolase
VEVHGMRLAGATFVDYAEPSGNAPNVDAIKAVDLEAFKAVILDYFDEGRLINATRVYSDVVQ